MDSKLISQQAEKFNIRHAKIDDVPEIAAMWEEFVKELKPELTPNSLVWAEHCLNFMQNDTYKILVAEDSNKNLIGFIDGFIFHEPSTDKVHGICQHFFVEPAYRNSMVAARLYRQGIKVFKSNNCDLIEFFCFKEELPMWNKKKYNEFRYMVRRGI